MRELIGSVLKNDELQNNLRQAGYERVKLFDKSVEYNKTLELYSKIVTSNGKNLLTC
jgi:glycosyltransferase involved in cell wall biosynthesis